MDNTTSCDQLSLKNKTSQKALKFAHTVRSIINFLVKLSLVFFIIMLGITTSVIFCYSDGVTDVVKSNGKTLSASTANSVGMKDVKNKNSDDTIYRKTLIVSPERN